jgi:hypothetical protein
MAREHVEDVGIFKGRWRILKSGIRLQGVDAVDKIWLTCCALHNWLLEIDGLNAEWSEISITGSDWEGELGDCDFEGINVVARTFESTFGT